LKLPEYQDQSGGGSTPSTGVPIFPKAEPALEIPNVFTPVVAFPNANPDGGTP